MSHTDLLNRITVRPDVFGGKPIIRDMRVSVELILSLLAQGVTPEAKHRSRRAPAVASADRTTFGRCHRQSASAS